MYRIVTLLSGTNLQFINAVYVLGWLVVKKGMQGQACISI